MKRAACLALVLVLPAGHGTAATPVPTLAAETVMAVNVGGEAYRGRDGIRYSADTAGIRGRFGSLQNVKGSQDATLYRTFREGAVSADLPLAPGTYDVTFHFAEPAAIKGGERVFDVFVEGVAVIEDLDIMAWRDGKIESALTVTVPDLAVSDGELSVHFEAKAGLPVLSALVVRRKRPPDPAWKLDWFDDFDGRGLDLETWTPDVWPARKVNDEDQAYTARPKNLRVQDGLLIIEAHREDHGGAEYTSARIHTSGKADIRYGRIEVRAKLPRGMGTWPAIWMLPSNPFTYATACEDGDDWQGSPDCDAWPNSGEIDIMEHVGYQMGHVHGTVHNEAYYWLKWEQRKGRILLPRVDDDFHVFALEWSPERIDVYADGTHYFSYVNEGDGWRSWPYDHPFHLVVNVAVGGMWGRAGGGIDERVFPQAMVVDYVRVLSLARPANAQ